MHLREIPLLAAERRWYNPFTAWPRGTSKPTVSPARFPPPAVVAPLARPRRAPVCSVSPVSWDDGPAVPRPKPFPILTVKHQAFVQLLGPPVGVFIHWHDATRRSLPCTGSECPHCRAGSPSRWAGYAPAMRYHHGVEGRGWWTPVVWYVTRRLVETFPTGQLFRGRLGQPLTKQAIRLRFRNLRRKLPHLEHFCAYSYRHTYCADALVNGVGIAHVAELMGHTSTEMVSRVYSKLSQQVAHMREAAAKAVPGGLG